MGYMISAVEPNTKHEILLCFVFILLILHACVYMHMEVYLAFLCRECMWRPEDNLRGHPQECYPPHLRQELLAQSYPIFLDWLNSQSQGFS